MLALHAVFHKCGLTNLLASHISCLIECYLFKDDQMVERIIESQLKITNVSWSEDLSNETSLIYMEMKDQLEVDLAYAFCLEMDNSSNCHVEVTGFSHGSVIVHFRVVLKEPSNGMSSEEEILEDMHSSIASKGNIGSYAVNESSFMISECTLRFCPCLYQKIYHSYT